MSLACRLPCYRSRLKNRHKSSMLIKQLRSSKLSCLSFQRKENAWDRHMISPNMFTLAEGPIDWCRYYTPSRPLRQYFADKFENHLPSKGAALVDVDYLVNMHQHIRTTTCSLLSCGRKIRGLAYVRWKYPGWICFSFSFLASTWLECPIWIWKTPLLLPFFTQPGGRWKKAEGLWN